MLKLITGWFALIAFCFALTVQAQDFGATKRAAEQGDVAAQSMLGNLYYQGQGVAQSYAEAAKWFRKAAEQGDAHGQYVLGLMYISAQGVSQDFAEGEKWLRKAADQGHKEAQEGLQKFIAPLKEAGAQDFTTTKRAAERGDAAAQSMLGNMYYQGQGVAQNYAEAAKWFRKAAEQGDAHGQYILGLMYVAEQGVAQDFAEGEKWLRKAADQGHKEAQEGLKKFITPLKEAGVLAP